MENIHPLFIAIYSDGKKGMVFDFEVKEKLYLKVSFGYDRTGDITTLGDNIHNLTLIPAESCKFDENDRYNTKMIKEMMKKRGVTLEKLNEMNLPEKIYLEIENYGRIIDN
ncbi:hypothetical protein ES703_26739 [subsurface metagenome]